MNGQLHRLDTLRKVALGPVILFGLLSILATGGGGGDGGGGGGTTGGLTYVGNTDPAVITTTNASKLTANVIGGAPSPGFTSPASADSGTRVSNTDAPRVGAAHLAQRLDGVIRETLAKTEPASSMQHVAPAYERTELCDSGSIRTFAFGTLNNDGTGTLTIDFNDCRFGDETLSGSGTITIIAFDLGYFLPTDFTVSFPLLTFSNSALGINIGMSGSLHSQIDIFTATETITVNIVGQDNNTSEMIKVKDLVMVNVYDNIYSPSSYSQTVSGRVYDSIEGYVEINTIQSLVFGTLTQSLPDSGQVVLTGDTNSHIRVTALSAMLVQVELDLDGNSAYELKARLHWNDLGEPIGVDLGDDDMDGMHNSWETFYGLDPSDPADAQVDSDGDDVINLDEYLAGTDPVGSTTVEPDDFAEDQALTNVVAGVTLSVADGSGAPQATDQVVAFQSDFASTGSLVFGRQVTSFLPVDYWYLTNSSGHSVFRADFDVPVRQVSIDVIRIGTTADAGALLAYDASGVLLDTAVVSVSLGAAGTFATATINRPTADIAYILAGGYPVVSGPPFKVVALDNLRFSK